MKISQTRKFADVFFFSFLFFTIAPLVRNRYFSFLFKSYHERKEKKYIYVYVITKQRDNVLVNNNTEFHFPRFFFYLDMLRDAKTRTEEQGKANMLSVCRYAICFPHYIFRYFSNILFNGFSLTCTTSNNPNMHKKEYFLFLLNTFSKT
jgi:hypothetical protein